MTSVAPPIPQTAPPRTVTRSRRQRSLSWLALPALAFFVVFGLVPLVGVLLLSFTTWDGIGTIHPSGLTSWRAVLSDPGLPHAIGVTFKIMALSWLFQTPMSILLGVFIAGHQRYRAVLSVFFFIPLLLSSAAIAITYKALLDPNFGLGAGLHIGFLSQDWLGQSNLAVATVVFVVSWQFIPFHTLIYQGAIRQIPTSMYEAAEIDGAGQVRIITAIKLPAIRGALMIATIFSIIGSFQLFNEPSILRPLALNAITTYFTPNMYAYYLSFSGQQYNYSATIAIVMGVITMIVAYFVQLRGMRKAV